MNPVFSFSVKALVTALLLMASAATYAYSLYKQSDIEQMIIDEANRQGVSPSLALAIARVESNFDPYAESHVGARGVMQIMPATAMGEFSVASSRLYDPRVNIELGVAFIKQLIATYGGRVDIALSHYNGGSRVKDKYNNYRIIPATRSYVSKVLAYQREYLALGYDEGASQKDRQLAMVASLDDFSRPRVVSDIPVKTDINVDTFYSDDPRVNKLQQLRVHNLTRNAGRAKNNQYLPATGTIPVRKMTKQEKVAQWESVYR